MVRYGEIGKERKQGKEMRLWLLSWRSLLILLLQESSLLSQLYHGLALHCYLLYMEGNGGEKSMLKVANTKEATPPLQSSVYRSIKVTSTIRWND